MGNYTELGVLYTAVQTALLSCVRYWLYKDSLRCPAKRMYAAAFLIALGGTGLWLALGESGGIPFPSFRMLLAVSMYVLSCLIIREPFAKHTYTYSFILVYDLTLEYSASYVQLRLMPGERGWVFALTAAALLALSFRPAARYLKRMIRRLTQLTNDRIWVWLCVISFTFAFMNLLFTYPPQAPTLRHLLSRFMLLLGTAGLYAATVRAMQTMSDAAQARAELSLVKRRVTLQEQYYARLVAQMDEIRRMRHDLRHHRAALAALAKSGSAAALQAYADAVFPAEDAVPFTGNLAADSVLLYYTDAARALDTRVETELSFTGAPVSDSDLCVILGNLLENAVDAQAHVPPARRYIRVRARADQRSLTLAVDNRFDGTLLRDEAGTLLSRKSGEGHGLGLSSVRELCEKNGGLLQLDTQDDLFLSGVVIGI